ncbi:type VI secretion system ATPase TssH [Burkholderia pseudomallei]|uniref:type VI secretion system ATPase TssH n=1 Tax=Burkholderia pseudomallei TaxID=28450 RepID=UPI00052A62F3|nr:type VI secretion system ATPase TssH [Burkholderia pseudomallei]AIV58461.1 type VI secretion ATPase, ClpV1 family [Burkholderia pseudomallei MSHR2243]AIV72851.1 type VI secretion ATPase, ClpV1 family [Burkholderia pseudomallei MSHR62]KGU66784.1 type VI secretion ATPase, ClpV1 family [Burkholderia pseudomallei MSHR465J]KGW68310.1 type VI secretion ATPase, ClpV1 family [Burkholderia pseudomallei MSHR3458]KGX43389.1 type VI secretion ATPase, ClpV1 family [Burkholderia pseudomallei MSHR3709]
MSTPLKTLIAKLNPVCRKATERAASHCFARGHYEVDLEHLFLALLDESTGDVPLVLRASGVDPHALRADLERELERLKTGNTRTPVFSVHLSELFEQAWLIASLDSQIGRIRSGHLLLALLTGPDLAQFAQRMSSQFARVRVDDLKHKFDEIAAGSSEAEPRHADADVAVPDGAAASGDAPRGPSKTPALDTYTTNLTQRAREGKIDPVIGRDAEIRQAIDILMRRRQNNPIMTGEAGVGKTAVVEGLALRIAADDVPPPLRGVALHVLDMGLLQAGASVKGEFENRLKRVIDEVKKSAHPIILFIDEAHTIIGAGGQAGQNDAANLLKPALARGELRTIAATTWSEYKKYFEKDAALARRFQVVKIEEPSEPLAAAMLRGMAALMERHFNVRVLDDAITEAVRLSHRYISGRQLPDKAISVLDTACAKVALAHSSTPAAIDDAKKRIERIDAEIAALEREAASGAAHDARLAELREARDADLKALAEDAARYEEERALVTEIGALRAELDAARESSADGKPVDVDATRAKLAERVDALRARQGNQPMVPLQVDGHVVAEIVASWTGIPLGRMVKDEIETVLNLRDLLGARVIGQDHALGAIAQRVRTATANLEDPNKPRGVFMFVGPSGVGKTETALALADVLYGGERKLITINMSEYQEAHSVSGLKGSPPGYVGYGEGGVLTEAVRRNPYSVVLLDEVEKAHPDVLEMFFQVFDKGAMDDAEGREIDFRNTLIILTSNVGSSAVMQACLNKAPQELPDAETLAETLRPQLYKTFKPAFLGRMKVIPYYPISDDVLAEIIELKLERIRRRIEANHKAAFEWDESLVDAVLARCTEVDSGARNVDHILNGTLLPEIAELVLSRIADGEAIVRIAARAAETGEFEYTVE